MICLQVWWYIICLLQVCEWNSYTTARAPVLTIKKKLIIESLGTQKLPNDISVSKHLSIYTHLFSFNSTAVERCSWKMLFLEICFLFQMLFSPQCLRKKFVEFFTAILLLLSATLIEVEVLNRLASNRNNN